MTLPLNVTPARRAVENALTRETGFPRSLGADGLGFFKLLPPAAAIAQAKLVKDTPGALVSFRNPRPDASDLSYELSDRRRVLYDVDLALSYYSGDPRDLVSNHAALERIERDLGRVINALCYPGALELDPAGDATGLIGDSLQWDASHSTQGPEPWPLKPTDANVLRVTHRFRASLELRTA